MIHGQKQIKRIADLDHVMGVNFQQGGLFVPTKHQIYYIQSDFDSPIRAWGHDSREPDPGERAYKN